MGYLFLSLALISGATKGFFGKKTSGLVSGIKGAALANLIRMLLCIFIGFIVVLFGNDFGALSPTPQLIMISMLSGVSTAVFVVSWLVAVKKSAYMLLDVFSTLGILIPLILSNLIFHEKIKITQWLGVGVLFVAVLLLCSYNNSIKEKLKPISFLLLIICGISGGLTDFSQKLFAKTLPNLPASVFNFYTYVFASAVLAICYLFIKSEKAIGKDAFIKIFGFIVIMAICHFFHSYFKTLAAKSLDSILLYPLHQGATLILATIMSALFFREKITLKCLAGIIIAFIGLTIINVL